MSTTALKIAGSAFGVLLLLASMMMVVTLLPEQQSQAEHRGSPPSKEQIYRLFETSWIADEEATEAFFGNESIDADALDSFTWLYIIQQKTTVFFKDTGLQWSTDQDTRFIELPVGSPEFVERIYIIDRYTFAYLTDQGWLVFRAAQ